MNNETKSINNKIYKSFLLFNRINLFILALLPSSRNYCPIWKFQYSFSVHLIVLKIPHILFVVLPYKSSLSTHFPIFDWTFIVSKASFYPCGAISHQIFLELSFILPLILSNDSFAPNIADLKIALVNPSIVPHKLSFTVLKSILKVPLILISIAEFLNPIPMWLFIFPRTGVYHIFLCMAILSSPLYFWSMKLSSIIAPVRINEEVICAFKLSISEIAIIVYAIIE